jgi:hypothetical protein
MIETYYNYTIYLCICHDANILPPFQGGLGYAAFLGLKPQAESFRPFGAETECLASTYLST